MDIGHNFFEFNGVSSRKFGLQIEEPEILKRPRRIVNRIQIPGRSADFLDDTGEYENVEIAYSTWVKKKNRTLVINSVDDIALWLSPGSYKVLMDSYDHRYFRRAACIEPLDPDGIGRFVAKQTVIFTCDPYKYLKTGEDPIGMSNGGALFNPEKYTSLPLLEITGTDSQLRTVTINDKTWQFRGDVVMDCRTKEVTGDGNPADGLKLGAGYPVLEPGNNSISVGSNTWLTIRPRWRRL